MASRSTFCDANLSQHQLWIRAPFPVTGVRGSAVVLSRQLLPFSAPFHCRRILLAASRIFRAVILWLRCGVAGLPPLQLRRFHLRVCPGDAFAWSSSLFPAFCFAWFSTDSMSRRFTRSSRDSAAYTPLWSPCFPFALLHTPFHGQGRCLTAAPLQRRSPWEAMRGLSSLAYPCDLWVPFLY